MHIVIKMINGQYESTRLPLLIQNSQPKGWDWKDAATKSLFFIVLVVDSKIWDTRNLS